jgi:hypothetical protein
MEPGDDDDEPMGHGDEDVQAMYNDTTGADTYASSSSLPWQCEAFDVLDTKMTGGIRPMKNYRCKCKICGDTLPFSTPCRMEHHLTAEGGIVKCKPLLANDSKLVEMVGPDYASRIADGKQMRRPKGRRA